MSCDINSTTYVVHCCSIFLSPLSRIHIIIYKTLLDFCYVTFVPTEWEKKDLLLVDIIKSCPEFQWNTIQYVYCI